MNTMYKNPNKFVQFEFWKDCSQGCRFCCNKGQPKINKKESIQYIMDILNSDEIKEYNEVGFIGGEFFNGEIKEVKEEFYKVFEKVSLLNFDKIYITATLIYDISMWLIPFLNYLKELNILNKVMICSSFLRMYFYEQEFGYTFLRLMVFFIQATELILIIPSIAYVFNKKVKLLKSYIVIITRIWLPQL